jgi:hypothetical protein
MFPLTRILSLIAACVLIALAAAIIPARAEDSAQGRGPRPALRVDQVAQQQIGQCHSLRRAISRRACLAQLRPSENLDVAENQ